MYFFDLGNISEKYMEIINSSSHEKILDIGEILGVSQNSRIIDFGCGYGEVLAVWAKNFSISGTGIVIREHACNRAWEKCRHREYPNASKLCMETEQSTNLKNIPLILRCVSEHLYL